MTTKNSKLVDIDPMTVERSMLKAESIQLKIDRTGLIESYCYGQCKKILPIEHFTIHRTGSKRNKGKKSTKQRKNTPSAQWAPRNECNKCLVDKKRISGQYDKDLENKRKSYRNNEALKKSLKEAAIKARKLLSDSYIKKLLKAKGYTTEQIEDNPELIRLKRKEVKAKRRSAANKTYEKRKNTGFYSKRERKELRVSYLKRRIKESKGYKGEEITKEMIEKKRKELLHERATHEKAWVIRKTPQEKKVNRKAVSDKRIKTLSDVYIRACIKHCIWYKGEEITDKMIEEKRQEIELQRIRKKQRLEKKEKKSYAFFIPHDIKS